MIASIAEFSCLDHRQEAGSDCGWRFWPCTMGWSSRWYRERRRIAKPVGAGADVSLKPIKTSRACITSFIYVEREITNGQRHTAA